MGRNKVNDHMYLCISSVKNDISIFHSLFFMFVYRNSVDLLLTDHESQRTHTLILWASNAKFLWTGRIHIALYSVHQPKKCHGPNMHGNIMPRRTQDKMLIKCLVCS